MKIFVIDPQKEFKQEIHQFPNDYVSLTEAKKIKEQLEREKARVDDMLDLVRVLKAENRPLETTTDPTAIEECWKELEQKIKGLK